MSDTPLTDAVQHGPAAGSFFAMTEHARTLERENAKLRDEMRDAKPVEALQTAAHRVAELYANQYLRANGDGGRVAHAMRQLNDALAAITAWRNE